VNHINDCKKGLEEKKDASKQSFWKRLSHFEPRIVFSQRERLKPQ
jgi:hypothetical protein